MEQRTDFKDNEVGVLVGHFHWKTITDFLPSLAQKVAKFEEEGADLNDFFQLAKVKIEGSYRFVVRQLRGENWKEMKFIYGTAEENELKEAGK